MKTMLSITVVILLSGLFQLNNNNYVVGAKYKSAEERLLDDLFTGYNPSARPVINSSATVHVDLQFSLLQIQDLDVRNQILTTTGLLILQWMDERLAWSDAFSDISEIVVNGGSIWRPEFAVINGAESIYGEYTEFHATLRSDGLIRWEPGGVFKTMCSIDITYYPFDEQVCDLIFGAWSYYTTKMNLTTESSTIKLDTYELNGEWEIKKTSAVRNEFNFGCCPHQRFSNIGFRLDLRRRHTFYIMNVILPGILTSAVLLSIFFCVPSQKVHIGVAALLSFRLFLVNVADTIPRTSDHVPLLVIYLTCTMAITTLAMIATVIVANLYDTKDKPVPIWMKKIFFGFVARMLCKKQPMNQEPGNAMHSGKMDVENGKKFRVVTLVNPSSLKVRRNESKGRGAEYSGENAINRSTVSSPSSAGFGYDYTPFFSRLQQSLASSTPDPRKSDVQASKPEVPRADYAGDWSHVAAVCDRFFFWLCLVFIIVTTLILFHPLLTSRLLNVSRSTIDM